MDRPRPRNGRAVSGIETHVTSVFVPGVAATVLKGNIGANPWAVVHHWKFGSSVGNWTQSNMDLLALTVYNAWGTTFKANAGGNISTTEVDAQDMTDASGVGSVYTHTPVFGAQGAILEPSSACIIVQNRIASRYRGGHPRTYWPCLTTQDMLNENTWATAKVAAITANMVSFVSAVIAASYTGGVSGLQHVIPRYTYSYTDVPGKHKYTKTRTGLQGVYTVQSYFGVSRIASQRRRLSP